MVSKKEEYEILQNRSEKDLWCQDLDDFVQEWEVQLKEDAEYQKSIRNTNRRVSRKIGAGKNIKSRKNDDDDFAAPKAKSTKPLKPDPAKGVQKVEHRTHKGFLEMFNAKPKPRTGSMGSDGANDALSDDDFAALEAGKSVSAEPSQSAGEQPGRAKRAAAAAPKKWVVDDEESEEDDSKYLGDIGDMVKGIGGGDAVTGRVSLFAMSRPGPSLDERPTSSSGLPKSKQKTSKPFDLSDGDETNYEMLAKSSPHKSAVPKNTLDSFLSDDDDEDKPIVTKKAPVKVAPAVRLPSVAPVPKAPAKRGLKPKKVPAKEPTPATEPKQVALSPTAKAYAAKRSKMELGTKNDVFSDEEDDDIEMNDSPPPKPAPKTTKAKASSKRAIVSDDEDDFDMDDIAPPKPTVKAAKSTKTKLPAKTTVLSDVDDDPEVGDSPPPKPATGRGRPARAAVSKAKARPIYIDSDSDDDEEDFEVSVAIEEDSEDEFD
jgi:DNA topoisomerase-2